MVMKEQLRRCGCLQPQVTSHCRIRNTPGLRRLGRRCSAKCPPLRVVGKGEKPARHLWLVAPGEDQAVKGCGCGLQKGGGVSAAHSLPLRKLVKRKTRFLTFRDRI